MEHFDEATRRDPAFVELARKLRVTAPPEIDSLYPRLRPARVTVTTTQGKKFTRQADEALGSRLVPFGDEALTEKFLGLVAPALGDTRARELAQRLWAIEEAADVAPLVESTARPR
jgi:2-methylcitrate dehydratase PrpD